MQRGALVNLYVAEQQYAYARKTKTAAVVVAINNDSKTVAVEFDASPAFPADNVSLVDRLGAIKDAKVSGGRMKVKLPERSASIFVQTWKTRH
jgi:O-glycosyl hydrolase